MATTLSEAFTNLLTKITNTDTNVESLASKIDEVKTAVEAVSTDSTTDNEAMAALTEQLTSVQSTLASVPTSTATSEDVSAVAESVASVSTSVASMSETVDTMNETVAALREAVESLNSSFTSHTIEVKATGVLGWKTATSSDESIATTSIVDATELIPRYKYESGGIKITSVAPGTATITAVAATANKSYYDYWFGVYEPSGTIVVTVADDGSITVDQPFNYNNRIAPVSKIAVNQDLSSLYKRYGSRILVDYEGNQLKNSSGQVRTISTETIQAGTNIDTDFFFTAYDDSNNAISLSIDSYKVLPIYPSIASNNSKVKFGYWATSGSQSTGTYPAAWPTGYVNATIASSATENQTVTMTLSSAKIIDTTGEVDEFYRYPLKDIEIDSTANSVELTYDIGTYYKTVINKTFSFTSYSDATTTEALATGTVKVTDIDFDTSKATVEVLTNSVDGFAGNSYVVNATDYTSNRLELFDTDGNSTGIYVELQE